MMSGFTGWREGPGSRLDFLTRGGVPLTDRGGHRKAISVSEKEALQKAADEARKVARAAREFGRVLDDYAKYVTKPDWRGRAVELHLEALNKLGAVNAGLIACSKWVAESSRDAVAPPPEPKLESGVSEKRAAPEPGKARAVQIKKKGSVN